MGKIIPLYGKTDDDLLVDAMEGLDPPTLWCRRALLNCALQQNAERFLIATLKRRKSAEDKVIIDQYWMARRLLRIVEDALRVWGIPVEQLG